MLSLKQIDHLAKLSKLDLTEEEKKKFATQLSSILTYMNQLNEVDLSTIPAMDHITGQENITRPDESHLIYSAEEVLAAAPDVEDGQVRVKSVLKHK